MRIIDTELVFRNKGASRNSTEYIVLHHAAAENCTVGDVHSWHLSNGWAGIGYHFFVDRNGGIFKGRDLERTGAHCPAVNGCSVGICFEGNFDLREMGGEQLAAGRELIKYLLAVYPQAKVIRHCDAAATACPGKKFPFAEMTDREKVVLYRIRRNFRNEKSQRGAFAVYENAVKACPPRFAVYDGDGNELYRNGFRASDGRKALRQSAGLEEDDGSLDLDGDGKTTEADAEAVLRDAALG